MAVAGLRFCKTCSEHTTTEQDEARGHVVCTQCGGVIEESAIVAEVQFMETAKGASMAEGFSLSSTQARVTRKVQGRQSTIRLGENESRETTIANGHRRIQEISSQPQIRMNERHANAAQRYFNLAVINNFTKGRKLSNVVAACLYIVCRLEKTAHMLIDFADALSTNVYQIGATFLKLLQVIHIKLPLVDPSLYIQRFANRLDLEDKTQLVIRDANRLVARMNRDWIHIGRRPAGICAACLFISCRMNGFKRTFREIILVVKICETTLRKRLRDFKETPSSNLTVNEFQTVWLEESQDPPSYTAGRKRDLNKLKELNENDIENEDYLLNETLALSEKAELMELIDKKLTKKKKMIKIPVIKKVKKIIRRPKIKSDIENKRRKLRNKLKSEMDSLDNHHNKLSKKNDISDEDDDEGDDMEEVEIEEEITVEEEVEVSDDEDEDENDENDDYDNDILTIKAEEVDQALMKEVQELMNKEETKDLIKEFNVNILEDEENALLSDLDDDDEIINMLNVTSEEIELKNMIWVEENREWLEKQELKKKEEKNKDIQPKNKSNKTKKSKKLFKPADTPAESAKLMLDTKPRTSRKINYEVLDTLFDME